MLVTSFVVGALAAVATASPLAKRQSSVPVGTIINSCTQPGVIALAFDDGPFAYTNDALDKLAAAGFKATFFVNGQNWANIYDYSSVVQRVVNDGHQIASHTWSHADLTTLSVEDIQSQMTQLEDALRSIVNKVPTYMRPPYFSTNAQVLSTLGGLGYHIIQADIDTLDWANTDNIQASVDIFNNGVANGGNLILAHDVHPETVNTLLPAMISTLQARGLRGVSVGECLGDAPANWYK